MLLRGSLPSTSNIAQGAEINATPLHYTELFENFKSCEYFLCLICCPLLNLLREFSSLSVSEHLMFLREKRPLLSVYNSQTDPSPSHLRIIREQLTVVPLPGTSIASPDPTLAIDGSKLAMNPSMHSAVPTACQLAETKPFVGLLNPTDGEVDSK